MICGVFRGGMGRRWQANERKISTIERTSTGEKSGKKIKRCFRS
jgi:hypothetical protein